MRIVVTGAASGLGAALSTRFLSARHTVLGIDCAWPQDQHEETNVPNAIMRYRADLADRTAIAGLVERICEAGAIDVVIHNAGINAAGPFENLDQPAMHRIIAVNLRAPMLMTAALLKQGLISEGGSLVFVGSLSSYLSYPGAATYAASKDGLLAYAKSLTPALARRRIACLSVLPGPLDTAHARIHAPPGADERGRLDPAAAADEIYRAVQSKRESLVPGWRAKLYSGIGIASPRLAERMMRKIIFLPLRDAARAQPLS
ncbi:SDR family oxidoreductase [Pelagibius sp. Alg239-R121]|uniref:SDR family NAD(P)-dependent oxidoreductase n=1 Tax=Pelagibius sp. Alg239-R121 TaxID=2993448 RepID=UPI0024A6D831|nr:SDR family NAD(P)-dependent oxidoreductase [Pelagibius sp. Alg239-R121]